MIGKTELCGLIPHAGSMCLLDGVLSWNAEEIRCTATSHLDPANPLRCGGQLTSVHLLEYGVQATAVHGALLARESGEQASPGHLAALHEVSLRQQSLADITTVLEIHAWQMASSAGAFMYRFTVSAREVPLVSGRATVVAVKDSIK